MRGCQGLSSVVAGFSFAEWARLIASSAASSSSRSHAGNSYAYKLPACGDGVVDEVPRRILRRPLGARMKMQVDFREL
ncbi:MAG: hypothetical protein QGH20_06005 [Candidatus Latescibacteria bacterium]|nr:hypothetical protein [Candidatus Latescibacterota bacterium]